MFPLLVLCRHLYDTAVGGLHICTTPLGALVFLLLPQPARLFLPLFAFGAFLLGADQLLGLQTADFARCARQQRTQRPDGAPRFDSVLARTHRLALQAVDRAVDIRHQQVDLSDALRACQPVVLALGRVKLRRRDDDRLLFLFGLIHFGKPTQQLLCPLQFLVMGWFLEILPSLRLVLRQIDTGNVRRVQCAQQPHQRFAALLERFRPLRHLCEE